MVCKHCGEEITNNSKYCNFCGKKIPVIKEKPIKKEKTIETEIATEVLEKKKIKILPIFISFVLIIILILSFYFLYPDLKYKSGIKKFNQGDYLQAQTIFTELDDYKDSKQKIVECKYNIASEYIEKENYLEALKIFEEIKSFSDSSQKIIEVTYLKAKEFYNSKNYLNAIDYCTRIENYSDSKKIITDSKYQYAIQKYDEGDFTNAVQYFNQVIDYQESKLYLNKIDFLKKLQGTYAVEEYVRLGIADLHKLVIKGPKIYSIFNLDTGRKVYSKTIESFDFKNKTFISIYEYFKVVDEKLYIYDILDENKISSKVNEIFIRQSTSTYIPEQYSKPTPRIGMTSSEVKNSTWGSPDKINKTTTTYGVSEQWVYGSGKYIYLENGIVTAIQE